MTEKMKRAWTLTSAETIALASPPAPALELVLRAAPERVRLCAGPTTEVSPFTAHVSHGSSGALAGNDSGKRVRVHFENVLTEGSIVHRRGPKSRRRATRIRPREPGGHVRRVRCVANPPGANRDRSAISRAFRLTVTRGFLCFPGSLLRSYYQ